MVNPPVSSTPGPTTEAIHAAEAALARLGFRRITANPSEGADFWVREEAIPERKHPVFLWEEPSSDAPVDALNAWRRAAERAGPLPRPIVIVPTERAAEVAVARGARAGAVPEELAVLVVPKGTPAASTEPRWHALVLSRREVLDVATGVVVGLFRRAQAGEGSSEIDFPEMLHILKRTFRIDLYASLGVDSDEAALFLLYQLARKYGFAPGDSASNLHLIVLRPTGPAARLPWFAA